VDGSKKWQSNFKLWFSYHFKGQLAICFNLMVFEEKSIIGEK
jgi:hypothetical protein